MVSTGESTGELLFACPECGASLCVNPAMRDTMIDKGCVMCESELSPEDFESIE